MIYILTYNTYIPQNKTAVPLCGTAVLFMYDYSFFYINGKLYYFFSTSSNTFCVTALSSSLKKCVICRCNDNKCFILRIQAQITITISIYRKWPFFQLIHPCTHPFLCSRKLRINHTGYSGYLSGGFCFCLFSKSNRTTHHSFGWYYLPLQSKNVSQMVSAL